MRSRPPRGRRRGPALQQAILVAAVDELLAHGYAGFTMDEVARRAGTNKNAIYRRWPSRPALVVAAYAHLRASTSPPPPDTGSLRADALILLRTLGRAMSSQAGRMQRSLMAAAAVDAELRRELGKLASPVKGAPADPWDTIVRRAVERGQASKRALHPRVAHVALDLLRHEHLVRGADARVPDRVLVEIVDRVFLPLVVAGVPVPRR
jgi:AcrR family transcriptional regulator